MSIAGSRGSAPGEREVLDPARQRTAAFREVLVLILQRTAMVREALARPLQGTAAVQEVLDPVRQRTVAFWEEIFLLLQCIKVVREALLPLLRGVVKLLEVASRSASVSSCSRRCASCFFAVSSSSWGDLPLIQRIARLLELTSRSFAATLRAERSASRTGALAYGNEKIDSNSGRCTPQSWRSTTWHLKMKPLFWDSAEIDPWTTQPYTFDSPNPNLTWDGIREPGDEGYVPPPPLLIQPINITKSKKMKHNSFYPTNVPEQIIWLTNFFMDRGQGWVELTYDTTPGYNDTQAFPAALSGWKYRAIYRVGDAQVGVWSAEASIVVEG